MTSILFLLNDFKCGGVTKVNVFLANKMSEKNKAAIYCMGPSKPRFPVTAPVHYAYKPYYEILRFTRKAATFASKMLKTEYNPTCIDKCKLQTLIKYIKKNGFDTLVCSADQINLIPFLKASLPHVKMIAWCHSTAQAYLNDYFKVFKKALVKGLKMADKVVCLTDADKKSYSKFSNNTVRIHNPLTISNTEKSNLSATVISFVGRIKIITKGIDYLCETAKYLPDNWTISVAGGGTESELQEFRKLIAQNGVQDRIEYKGALSGDDLNRHYKNSSIFILTSRWEGFGLVLCEAMSFGLPVVAFEQAGSKEILDGGKYGILIENGNTASMAKAINEFIKSRELRKKYQALSLERVKDFNIDRIASCWEDIMT